MKKLNELLFNQGGKCFYCDAVLDINEATLDHVVPQSKGGTGDLDNLVVCCRYANHAFKDYPPKHKMGVIKHLCCSVSTCKKIFPREEAITEPNGAKNVRLIENQLEQKPEPKKPEPKKSEQPKEQTQSTHTKAAKKKSQPDISTAYQLLCQAVELQEHNDGKATNSNVKSKMLALNPSFKETDFGFTQFNKFLLHAQEDKIVTLKAQEKAGNYIIKKK